MKEANIVLSLQDFPPKFKKSYNAHHSNKNHRGHKGSEEKRTKQKQYLKNNGWEIFTRVNNIKLQIQEVLWIWSVLNTVQWLLRDKRGRLILQVISGPCKSYYYLQTKEDSKWGLGKILTAVSFRRVVTVLSHLTQYYRYHTIISFNLWMRN